MKKIIILLMITLSSTASYSGTREGVELKLVDDIVIEKALTSGIEFATSAGDYQLILGGKAFDGSSSDYSAQSAGFGNNNIWNTKKGHYQLSIDSSVSSSMNASMSNNAAFKQIAYNSRTGQIGIIQGDIIVKLRPHYNAEEIAATFNIELVNHFNLINTAVYRPSRNGDIFSLTDNISSHSGVEFAEIDVIENFSIAM